MMTFSRLNNSVARFVDYWKLPKTARQADRQDHRPLPLNDPGPLVTIQECSKWLCRAQDLSTSNDGGVSRHYSLVTGWGPSYPETTGYIIPTVLDCADLLKSEELRQRARRMLDWLVSIQLDDGAFQAGTVTTEPRVPTPFNTGQILIGLSRGFKEFGSAYSVPMQRAADWLVSVQDSDGCWRKYPSPLVAPGEKSYDTHLAIGLFEAARLVPDKKYLDSAVKNVRWALKSQRPNGWLEKCCLENNAEPLTHTLGYALRGFLEAYASTGSSEFLIASQRTADGLLKAMRQSDGYISGRLDDNWRAAVPWSCLTGSAQIAISWLKLYEILNETRYLAAARLANSFLRRTIRFDGDQNTIGGVKGSHPISGDYGAYQYLSWACKFVADSNLLEMKLAGASTESSLRNS
ncbi:MAG: hypothetical protein NTW07_08125 [candidate division Zixibacteria bacterium]|nr:hypothetical protein [candidate division Zixibacteria bacterium]